MQISWLSNCHYNEFSRCIEYQHKEGWFYKKLATPCENVSSDICGLRRPRSAFTVRNYLCSSVSFFSPLITFSFGPNLSMLEYQIKLYLLNRSIWEWIFLIVNKEKYLLFLLRSTTKKTKLKNSNVYEYWQQQAHFRSNGAPLPGIIVLQELSLRLSIFQFRSVSINSLWLEARKRRLTCVAGV